MDRFLSGPLHFVVVAILLLPTLVTARKRCFWGIRWEDNNDDHTRDEYCKGLTTAQIIGISAAAGVGGLITTGLTVMFCRRRRRQMRAQNGLVDSWQGPGRRTKQARRTRFQPMGTPFPDATIPATTAQSGMTAAI